MRKSIIMPIKNIIRVAVITGLILLIPLTLQLTIGTGVDGQGWNWKLGDFVIIGALLFITSLAIDFAARKITNPAHRSFAIIAIVAIFLLIWVGMIHNIGERLLEKLFCGGVC